MKEKKFAYIFLIDIFNRIKILIFIPQRYSDTLVEKALRVSDYMVEKLSLAYTCS